MTNNTERARSFGAVAAAYQRLRPTYPPSVVAAILPPAARRVADVGAGTGKLTARLLELGVQPVAVEPDAQLGAVLAKDLPDVDLRTGVAEQLPLEDECVDAVVFGQAWHWADPLPAAREAHRVLRPGGRLAMLWNLHDSSVDWVAGIDRVTRGSTGGKGSDDVAHVLALPGFQPGSLTSTPWTRQISVDDLVELAGTWSWVSTLDAAGRERINVDLREHLATAPDTEGRPVLDLPMICTTWSYQRSS